MLTCGSFERVKPPRRKRIDGDIVFLCFAMGVVVLPVGLLVVTPLLDFLPRTSRLWRRGWAGCVGASLGAVTMMVFHPVSRGGFHPASRFPEEQARLLATVAAGATFAYVGARLNAPIA